MERTKMFLRGALANGSRRTAGLIREAAELGVSRRTLYRARDELGIQTLYVGGRQNRVGRLAGTLWRWPRGAPTLVPVAPLRSADPSPELGGALERPCRRPLPVPDLRWIV